MNKSPLLNKIDSPADMKRLSRAELRQLSSELREFVLHTVSQTGGHLGSNLGTVELTVALHYVFNTPYDRLVWDVGHQTYPHKVLTGRRERMGTLRQLGGIAGFPRRDESEYDTFGTAHSSTSISAALGMALAAKLKGEDRRAVAIIGDGAMSAGMAFEAMNNAGVPHAGVSADLLVVLNDNDMSISPPVGALNKYLARLMSGNFYEAARQGVKGVLKNAPPLFELARRFEEHAKGMVVPGTIFEEFGLNYVGPIDGHDLDALIPTLENLRAKRGPQFLHVVTKKGYGYKLAEADPVKYHAASGKFDPALGFPKSAPSKPTFTQVFGQWLCDMAEADERLVAITPAMREGSGMVEFHKRFPRRYHDVGIAEQHAVTFAAGLACEGLKPVVAIYSTFLQRGYDQLIHDVALQNLPVVFALDRAGIVGADGPTHAGAYDIAFVRCIPNCSLLAPSDENECRQALTTAFGQDSPVAVRYPRGAGAGAAIDSALTAWPWGKGVQRRSSSLPADARGEARAEVRGDGRGVKRIAILAFGTLLHPAMKAAQALDASVADMRFVKPLDSELVLQLARSHDAIVTVEEGCVMGGAGSAVGECIAAAGMAVPLLQLGLPDIFVEHGDPAKLLSLCGLDAAGIEQSIRQRFSLRPVLAAVNG
jgi:1-deoxy-D-xylulose-5-phosphate synthase